MRATWVIAKGTVKEAIRKRVLLVLLFFGLVAVGSSTMFEYMRPGEEIKLVVDIGLAFIKFFGILIAIFSGSVLIPTEVERRTIHVLLSKPVRRSEVLIGKFLGAYLTILGTSLLMSLIFIMVYSWAVSRMGTELPEGFNFLSRLLSLIKALVLIYVELGVITAISIAFSTVASGVFSSIVTFVLYIMGHTNAFIQHWSHHYGTGLGAQLVGLLGRILPNFEQFDVRQALLLDNPIPLMVMVIPIGWAMLYVGAVLLLGHFLFAEREF